MWYTMVIVLHNCECLVFCCGTTVDRILGKKVKHIPVRSLTPDLQWFTDMELVNCVACLVASCCPQPLYFVFSFWAICINKNYFHGFCWQCFRHAKVSQVYNWLCLGFGLWKLWWEGKFWVYDQVFTTAQCESACWWR